MMNSVRTRFLCLSRLRRFTESNFYENNIPFASLQSSGRLCFRQLNNAPNQDPAYSGSSGGLTLLQRDLETLLSAKVLVSKKDIVLFLDKAKMLLATSESFLSKEQLMSLLERVGQFGTSLGSDQIKNWSIPFWTAMSYQLTSIAKSCHICDISRILEVYVLAVPRDNERNKQPVQSSGGKKQLFGKLMSVLDLRLRQAEGKSHLPLGELEFKCVQSIFKSVSHLQSCSISTPLVQRLLLRITSNPEFWTEDHILILLEHLEKLKYIDKYAKFCTFVVNKLEKKEIIDQHQLCQILHGLSLIKPKYISYPKVNSILWNSLANIEDLKTEEIVGLVQSLAKMNVDVEEDTLKLLFGHLFLRTSSCTPTQLSTVISSMSKLPETSMKIQMCSAAAIELTRRVSYFNANDLARMMFGLCHLHYHPGNECISKVISQSLDILLEDEIVQSTDAITSVETYNEFELSTKIKGMMAKAELDDLKKPFHFTNRTKLKHLKNAIATEQFPETSNHQKHQYENFKGYELAALIFSLAQMQLGSLDDKFFEFVKEEIMRDSIPLDVFELTFALWGVALSGHLDRRLFMFALKKVQEDDARDKHPVKIRMAKSLLTLLALGPPEERIDMESNLYLWDCYKLWLEQECHPSVTSPIIHDAIQLLQKLGFNCEVRCQLNNGTCVADVLRGVNGQTFALEIRPLSFTNVENQIPGESQWRLKILEAAGCTVLYIKSINWAGMDKQHKIEYLKRLTGLI